MRIFLKLISLLLIFVWMSTVFSGCKKEKAVEVFEKANPNEVLLADFESYEELTQIGYKNAFGKIDVNTDKAYVTRGGRSAKLIILGDPSRENAQPAMYFYTSVKTVNFSDFSNVKELRIDFFNDSDRDINVYFGFLTALDMATEFSNKQAYVLEKKKWSTLAIPFDGAVLKNTYAVDKVKNLVFMFDNRTSKDEVPASVYVDNFRAVKYSKTPEFTKVRAENEILNFDTESDIDMLKGGGLTCAVEAYPFMSLNVDKKYVFSGIASLKVVGQKSDKVSVGNGWPNVRVESKSLYGIDFAKYKDLKNAALVFDVYNMTGREVKIFPEILAGDLDSVIGVTLNADGGWQEVKMKLKS